MNGYKIYADSYKKILESMTEDDTDRKAVETSIKIYTFMSELDEDGAYALFDTGIFNDICKSYLKKAMLECDIDKNKVSEVLEHMRWLFDVIDSKSVTNT